jgi:hypothetical protein
LDVVVGRRLRADTDWRGADYACGVEGEPRNAASDRMRAVFPLFSRLGDMDESELRQWKSGMADDFVRVDRRRVVAVPDSDRDDWFESMQAYWNLGKGTPSFQVAEVIAVRGERLVLFRSRIEYADGTATEMLIVNALADDMRPQRSVMFDVDDLEGAFVELDRLHAEIEAQEA